MKKKDVFMPADIIVSGDSKEDWYHGSNTPVIFFVSCEMDGCDLYNIRKNNERIKRRIIQ